MAESKDKLKKLQELVRMVDEGVTKDEFIKAFKQVVKAVQGAVLRLDQKFEQLEAGVAKKVEDKLATVKDGQKGERGEKGDRGESIKGDKGDPGKDANQGEMTDAVMTEMSTRFEEKAETFIEGPEEIRNKLELLKDDERLTWKAISGLEEELDKIKNTRLRVGGAGGGHTDVGVKFTLGRIVKTEDLSSQTIDGANTDFTTTATINAILSYMLNGEVVGANNYTVAGKTITWSVAPPAAYSGKDHQVIYV